VNPAGSDNPDQPACGIDSQGPRRSWQFWRDFREAYYWITARSGCSHGRDAMLLDRLAALFRRRSEATVAALALLRERRFRNELPTRSVPPVHLGGRGARQCRGRSHHGPPLRINALTAFILMQHPSLKAMQLPAVLLDDSDKRIASAARITRGSLARAGRVTHPAEADRIDAALVARYRQAKEVGERSDLLTALGNCVGPSVAAVDQGRSPRSHDSGTNRGRSRATPGQRPRVRSPAFRGDHLRRGPKRPRGCHFCRQLSSSNRTADR
jgi:hypothetical protein